MYKTRRQVSPGGVLIRGCLFELYTLQSGVA
nr:MAG TPA: Protein of unknown function (DUF753) [Caudoviricetes sp.]DAQ03708.1 MAG TPA: Protein of unknown function (DUF753) [Caudoviricetes sp.]